MDIESDLKPDEVLGSYRILSTLGRGGMGQVYLAEDSRLGRRVALKLLPFSIATDAERMARFEREARAASALNHPNILTIYETGSFDGRQFIASEYVDGETLRQRQLHSRLNVVEVLEAIIQVTSALSAAHQAGIVHRDIKPDNIMLRPDGYVKVVDFGLAKHTERSRSSADTSIPTMLQVETDSGVVMGTTAYMSPEQTRGLDLDARTDIWSLGVVLYEVLTGTMPFQGNSAGDLIVSILERDPIPLPANSLPLEFDWIVRKMLRKDREERYQTARELLGDLRGIKQQVDFAAHRERSGRSAAPESIAAVESTSGDSASVVPSVLSTTESKRVVTEELETGPDTKEAVAGKNLLRNLAVFGGLALLAIGVVALAYRFWPGKKTTAFASMKITRITNSGKVIDSILSPDGRYLVYALSDAGKQSLWTRQLNIANDKMILPPTPGGFFGIAFSRDGNDVYYAIKQNLDRGTLYRVPALGGTPHKILEGIDSAVTFSPDGKQLALVRGNFPNQAESSIVVANADGNGQRTLAVRKSPEYFSPIFFAGPSWSPDGKLIAAPVARVGGLSRIMTFAVTESKETDLTPAASWRRLIARVEWLPDQSGLLAIAGEGGASAQVVFVSYPTGEIRKITNDLHVYRSISISADGKKFTTIQTGAMINIWLAPEGDASRATQLTSGNVGFLGSGANLTWTPEGSIVYASNETGTLDLWHIDPSGQNRKQLTSNAGQNLNPDISRDGRFIVFSSSRGGNRRIWRMDLDGNNARELSNGIADVLPAVSPDSKWVVYSSLSPEKPTLWKVSIEGGDPIQLTKDVASAPSISPDGKYIAYLFPSSTDPLAPPNRIAVIPFEGGTPLKVFEFPHIGTVTPSARWSPDGRSVMYTVNNNNVTNVWSQALDGSPPKQITDFKDGLMTGFAWSRDGKTLAATRGGLLRDAVLISESE